MNNNPVRYTDPTGNSVDCGMGASQDCWKQVQHEQQSAATNSQTTSTSSGRRHDAQTTGCTDTLSEGFNERSIVDFSDHEQIDQSEFDDLLVAIYDDIQSEDRWSFDIERSTYDTPFYDGNSRGANPTRPDQIVCLGDDCYNQSSVNYVAQGMYSAAAGQNLDDAIWLVETWNETMYGHPANPDEIYWLTYGYEYYLQRLEGEP
jgi:hypothetical protein